MSVARVTEIIAASSKSFEDAVEVGVERAAKTLKNVTSAWVCAVERRVFLAGANPAQQLSLRLVAALADHRR